MNCFQRELKTFQKQKITNWGTQKRFAAINEDKNQIQTFAKQEKSILQKDMVKHEKQLEAKTQVMNAEIYKKNISSFII